jgi:hypothetical protein
VLQLLLLLLLLGGIALSHLAVQLLVAKPSMG